MNARALLLGLLMGPLAWVAAAQPAPYEIPGDLAPYGADADEVAAALANCKLDQMTMNLCAWHRYRDALQALDVARSKLHQALVGDPVRQARLARAQSTWVEFRNAQCDFEAARADGGSSVWYLAYDCRKQLTDERIAVLTRAGRCIGDEACARSSSTP